MKFHQLYKEYVRDYSSIKKRESSQQDQERLWRLHIKPEFAEFEIKKIKHRDIDAFISRKASKFQSDGGTGGRANNILALMSSMMNFARKRQYIKSNPCFGIDKIKSDHSWPEMTDTQRTALRSAAYNESLMLGLIIDMALITGARKQEILQARWEEFKGDVWTIPSARKKGKKEHILTLPPLLLSLIHI